MLRCLQIVFIISAIIFSLYITLRDSASGKGLDLYDQDDPRFRGDDINKLLEIVPRYLRFDKVRLDYAETHTRYGRQKHTIKEKCEWLQVLLLPLRRAMNESQLEFKCDIEPHSDSYYTFKSHTMLLNFIGDQLLPLYDSCRSYKFIISLDEKEQQTEDEDEDEDEEKNEDEDEENEDNPIQTDNALEKIMAAILQFNPIRLCTNVMFVVEFTSFYNHWLKQYVSRQPKELSAVAIEKWLNCSHMPDDDSTTNAMSLNERILNITLNAPIKNVSEIFDYIKTVLFC